MTANATEPNFVVWLSVKIVVIFVCSVRNLAACASTCGVQIRHGGKGIGRRALVSPSATANELRVFVFPGVAMNAVLLDFSMLLRARAMSVRFP